MAKIKKFSRPDLRLLREELETKLAIVGRKFGIELEMGAVRFSANEATFKIKALTIGRSGETKKQTDFAKYAESYGLKPTDLGRKFRNRTKIFEVTGLNTNKPKNALEITDQSGKMYICPASMVISGLMFSEVK